MGDDAGRASRSAIRRFATLEILWIIVFAVPLAEVARFALASNLQSYILLIPFISAWLAARDRRLLAAGPPAWGWGTGLAVAAAGALLYSQTASHLASATRINDVLSPLILAFVLGTAGISALAFGVPGLRAFWFPLFMLLFMVPLPTSFLRGFSVWLQEWSADAAYMMLRLVDLPMYREGLTFRFPTLVVEVAEECSGIHSSLVLIITGLLASHLFLASPWRRLALVLSILPIGVLRNGFRVTVISTLTEKVDPGIIDGPLHHQGGPIFFVLSLAVLFGVLLALRRGETRTGVNRRSDRDSAGAGP